MKIARLHVLLFGFAVLAAAALLVGVDTSWTTEFQWIQDADSNAGTEIAPMDYTQLPLSVSWEAVLAKAGR